MGAQASLIAPQKCTKNSTKRFNQVQKPANGFVLFAGGVTC